MSSRPHIVLFDLGHVIVDWQPLRLYRQLFASEDEARFFCEHVCNMAWHTEHDHGVSMADNAAPLIKKYPEYTAPIKAWKTRWLDMFEGYMPGVPPLMARLEERRVPLYGLSNLPAEVAQDTFNAFPIIKLLRDVVVSGEEGLVKPQPEIYEIARQRCGASHASEILFIDNAAPNVAAAAALGFHTHHFTGAADLEACLVAHGLL